MPAESATPKPKTRHAIKMWARLIKLLSRRDRVLLGIAAFCMIAAAAMKAIVPLAAGYVLSQAIANGHEAPNVDRLVLSMSAIGVLVVVQLLLETARRQLVEVVVTAFERDCRTSAYGKLLKADLDELRSMQNGAIYGRANRSIEGATKLLKLGGMDMLPAVATSAFALAAAFSQDWRVACVMFGVIPTGFALVLWQVRNQAGVRVRVRNRKEEIDGRVPEALQIIASIRAFGAERFVLGGISEKCDALRTEEMGHHRAMSLFDAAKSFNEALWLFLTLISAVMFIGLTPEAFGMIAAFIILTMSVHAPLRELHRIVDEVSECSLLTDDLITILDREDDVAFAPTVTEGAVLDNAFAPAFRLDSVSYSHTAAAETSRLALRDINLEIARGERVGIVGGSGCGKSTLVRVLRRLHHGYTGTIELGGVPLEDLSHEQLSRMIGVVTQEPQLLNTTVAENIRFGMKASDTDVVAAAKRASVHDEIMRLPLGYDTVIDENGASISGGQRQRVCIARALLREPQILLLDEPTSALDPANEAVVQAAIEALTDVTVVMIAHRLHTLASFDRIVVMHDGEIVEQGGFAELSTTPGHFARLNASASDARAA